MGPQEIFDTGISQIYTQGGPGRVEGKILGCQYRGKDGRKCVVGALISDEDYRSEFDTGNGGTSYQVANLIYAFPHLPAWLIDNIDLLKRLQFAHDERAHLSDADFLKEIAPVFKTIAEDFNLNTNVLDSLREKHVP